MSVEEFLIPLKLLKLFFISKPVFFFTSERKLRLELAFLLSANEVNVLAF